MPTLKLVVASTVLALIAMSGWVLASDVSVEGLTIKKTYRNSWAVYGRIRNNDSASIRGHVKIKFLDSNGDITKTALAYVNGNDPILPGQAAPFEYWTNPNDFSGISNFGVIFVDH